MLRAPEQGDREEDLPPSPLRLNLALVQFELARSHGRLPLGRRQVIGPLELEADTATSVR
jgi:hypothetical protein